MTMQWDELFALARELDHQANAVNGRIDPQKALQLVRIVLALATGARLETDPHPRHSRRLES
jgi:hypothetical protein